MVASRGTIPLSSMVECIHCQRQMHRICVLHHDSIWPEGYQCYNCLRSLKNNMRENRYTAKRKSDLSHIHLVTILFVSF